jgi:hypothetical protein
MSDRRSCCSTPTAAHGGVPASAAPASAEPAPAVPPAPPRRRFDRVRRLRNLFRIPRTRRGMFALLLVLAGLGGAAAFTGNTLIHWTETADFCGRHIYARAAAYEAAAQRGRRRSATSSRAPAGSRPRRTAPRSPRSSWALYLKLVPPPDHDNPPSPTGTCMRCHTVERLALAHRRAPSTLRTRRTPASSSGLIWPGGGDVRRRPSVHWHVLADVESQHRRAVDRLGPGPTSSAPRASSSPRPHPRSATSSWTSIHPRVEPNDESNDCHTGAGT